jgi:hypothetical protein
MQQVVAGNPFEGEQMHEMEDCLFHGEAASGRFRSEPTPLWRPKRRIRRVPVISLAGMPQDRTKLRQKRRSTLSGLRAQ